MKVTLSTFFLKKSFSKYYFLSSVINLEGNGEEEEEAEEENEEIDLRDIEFRLSYSEKELLESTGRNLTRADINLLKLILISGLYPNIAIPDEFNSNHKETDQIYHTQFKAFVYMHPTSIYYGRSILIPISDLLCYEKLLETNKPYITNAFRAPSLHALLLFAKTGRKLLNFLFIQKIKTFYFLKN